MPRNISDLSNEELVALATSSSISLDQISDEELAALAVQQGYLQEEEAAATLVEKKKRDREPLIEKALGSLPTDEELRTLPAEAIESRYTAHTLGRLALTKGGRAGDVAAQVVMPLAGAIGGAAAGGLPGAVAGGAAGGSAGDALKQAREYVRGERDAASPGELVTATIAGGVPVPAAAAGKPVAMMGRRAMQGAAIATGSEAVGQVIDNGSVDLPRLAATGALGLLFGGAVGAAESAVLRKQVLKAVRETPEFREFKGSDDELVEAVRTSMQKKPVNVTPKGPDDPPAALPVVTPEPPPTPTPSAQTQFEARAGITPAAPAAATSGATQITPGTVLRVAPGDEATAEAVAPLVGRGATVAPASGPADLRSLSDEQLIAVARQQAAADSTRNEAIQTTTPAAAEVTAPASTPESVSGSAAGQTPSSEAADSDGGQAPAEMPPAAVRVKPKGPRLGVGTAPDGSLDLLSLVEAEGGVRPPSAMRNAGGEYDGFGEAFGIGPARLLRNKNGPPVDVVLQRLEMNHGMRFDSPDAFYSALAAAARSRDQVKRAIAKQLYEGKIAAALFQNIGRKPALNAKDPIISDTVGVGQSLHLRGELYTATAVHPDTGELTLQGGTTIKIPAGTPIYPDKGMVYPAPAVDMGANPFEPRPSYAGGLAANNRYAELSQKLLAGTINPLERLELEAFEAGAGQHYVPGSMDPAAVQADRARAAAARLDAAKRELQARAQQRLIAGDLATQQDMFGPAIGDTGTLFEPGAQTELPYEFELSPTPGAPRPAPRAAQPPENRRVSPARGEPGIGVDPATYLADPIANAGPLAEALKTQQRISSIVADYFAGALPSWDPVGKLIRDAADVGALMAPLRNPYAESYKVVVLDPQARVQHAEVIHIGTINQAHASLAAVLRVARKSNARRVILSHNHPGGDPTPSTADWRVHEHMRDRLWEHNIELVDDVVTNGHAAYSLRHNKLIDMRHDEPAPWEKVRRRELGKLKPDLAEQLAAELRQSNPESAFVLYLTQRNALTAIEQVPASSIQQSFEILPLIEAGVAREGAALVILVAREVPSFVAREIEKALAPTAPLADIVTDQQGSFARRGVLLGHGSIMRAAAAERPGTLSEPAADDFTPAAPIIVHARGAGRGKASPYAKVNLAHLPNIKIVQMPELVRLVRELTGKLPELRKLRSSHGHFDSGDVVVRLDPRIFRDQLSAAKTLAHEIGHLVDYLDDGTLKRGNLLGRLHSLRSFLKNTFGASTVTNKELREELLAVTQWWKPYDPATTPDWFVKYRESAIELYADAISVLFNSPAELKARAPMFWTQFFAHLDKKPDTKAALLDLWDFLNKPHLQTLQRRSDEIRGMFVAGDELLLRKAAERDARYNSFRGWSDRFRQEIFDTFDPLVRRGAALERQGVKIPRGIDPRLVFDEHPLADNFNHRLLQRTWQHVVQPVEAAGFTLHELGEYLFLQRVLNEKFDPQLTTIGRAELANPLGMTPETARLGLLKMRLDAGWARFARLEAAATKFHEMIFERIQEAVEVGAYSRKIFAEVLAPNRNVYVTFAVLEHLQDYIPAGLRLQQGTFKEIANPFTSTLLKTVTLNRLIQMQKSKRGAVAFLNQFDPASIAPAERTFDGQRWNVRKPKDPNKALLELLDDGKPAGFEVDPAIVEMFERLPGSMVNAVTEVLNWPFRRLVYPLYIKYNPAFQLVLGPARDLRRTIVNLPARGGLKYAAEFVRNYLTFLGLPPTEAGVAVRAYLRGEPHPLISEMIARQAVGTPLDNFATDFNRGDKMEQMLRDYGLLPAEKQRTLLRTIFTPISALLERIEFAGLTFEMLPKVTAYKFLTRDLGWHASEAAHFARNNVGVPNIHKLGRHVKVIETVLPFFKVFVNGFRADLQLMTQPKTRGGWWFRWAASDGIWTMMQAAAAAGLLGAGLKELYDGISEYNNTNYNVLPIGTVAGGQYGKRVAYLRMPRDETHRWMSGLLYQGIMAAAGEASKPGASSILDFGADQVPGLNPVIKIGAAWKDYLEGQNPIDGFRGRPVLTNTEWLVGGWPAQKAMLGFTLNNAGVTNFVRWDAKAASAAEMTLSAVPGINRFIQTTDTGYRERQEEMQQGEARQRAQVRAAMPESVQGLLGEYYYLAGIKTDLRTLEQTQRLIMLKSWRTRIYQPMEDIAGAEISFGRRPDPAMLERLEVSSQPFQRGR